MRKKVIYFSAFLLPILLIVLFKSQLQNLNKRYLYFSACDNPIKYRIGTIDPEFKIGKNELLEDVKSAANIWNTTQNKTLFEYDPEANFTINMVYDERQILSRKISDLNSDLNQKQEEIDPKIEQFKIKQVELEKKINDLNQRITFWNENGGAPKDEYDKLVAEQKQLKEEASVLNMEAEELGQKTKEFNSNARTLNKTINQYQDVLEYKPEEGLYEQDGNKRAISIYIDVAEEEFLHTLAHELGHALGLSHVNNKDAIMYPQTTSDLTPSKEEIAELAKICEPQPLFEILKKRFLSGLQNLRERFKAFEKNNKN